MNTVYVLVEAKKEYTNELQKILTPRLYEGLKSIYEDILNIINEEVREKNVQSSSVIKVFQKNLKEIPQWNQELIKKEYSRIEKLSKCDYLEDLLEAVFITNTKILTSVQVNDNNSKNIKINIPQPSHFIHKCYMECAKEVYKNPYIFDTSKGLTPKERHNNLREALILIDTSINNAIRDLLPIRDILKQGLTKMLNKKGGNNTAEKSETSETSETSAIGVSNETEEDDVEEDEEVKEEEVKAEVEEIEPKKDLDEINNMEGGSENKNDDIQSKYESIFSQEVVNLNNSVSSISEQEEEVEKKSEPPVVELKEIIYNRESNNAPKKINSVEKMEGGEKIQPDLVQLTRESDIIPQRMQLKRDVEPKVVSVPTIKKDIADRTPFIKTVNQKIFFKNKFNGGNKNNSFYKQKYEQNSANYHSISDTDGDKKKEISLDATIASILEEKNNIRSQVIRNKIVLDEYSSEEEDEHNLVL
jgi:hypothetical protein